MVSRDHDRSLELFRSHHLVDDLPESCTLPIAEPADPGRQSVEGHGLLRMLDPVHELFVPGELAPDRFVGLSYVFRVSRDRDPPERSTSFGEHAREVERHNPLETEGIFDPGLHCLCSDVVAIVEHDSSSSHETDHRTDMDSDALNRPPSVLVRTALPQLGSISDRQTHRDIPSELVMGGSLVSNDIGDDIQSQQQRMSLRAVAQQADREGLSPLLGLLCDVEGLIQVFHLHVAVSVLDTAVDALLLDLGRDAYTLA